MKWTRRQPADQHLRHCGLDAFLRIHDHQLDATQPAPPQLVQELGPERLGFGRADVHAQHLAPSVIPFQSRCDHPSVRPRGRGSPAFGYASALSRCRERLDCEIFPEAMIGAPLVEAVLSSPAHRAMLAPGAWHTSGDGSGVWQRWCRYSIAVLFFIIASSDRAASIEYPLSNPFGISKSDIPRLIAKKA
jgi:hypothetical protein